MKKLISIVLIIAGIALGILGFTKLDDSTASAEIAGIELSVGDEDGQNQGYMMMGLGALLLVGGVVGMKR